MPKVKVLSPDVYTRVAAGEVIERPASVVKELVENSLDAGATDIEIHIERGGKQMIKVVDNGCGVDSHDMYVMFAPHATSKIHEAADLDAIATLGFRGEALASIRAVAKCEVISVVEGEQANRITCEDYDLDPIEPAVLDKGTVFIVRELFYNIPARAKFLKSDKVEEREITNLVSRFILGKPNISFRYYVDGKLNLQSYGGGMDEALAQIYGAKMISQCFKLKAEVHDFRITGYISNHNYYKPNKSYQTVFVNGRYIINNVIAQAIQQAYSSYLMKKQYPVYVLYIEMPIDFVDVNAHPNKLDVRFADPQKLFGAVYKVISSILDGKVDAMSYMDDFGRVPEIKSTSDELETKNAVYSESVQEKITMLEEKPVVIPIVEAVPDEQVPECKLNKFDEPPIKGIVNGYNGYTREEIAAANLRVVDDPVYDWPIEKTKEAIQNSMDSTKFYKNLYSVDNEKLFPGDEANEFISFRNSITNYRNEEYIDPNKANYREKMKEAVKHNQLEFKMDEYVFKGVAFDTYIMYERQDRLYIIDQHAAHERILYDSYMASIKDDSFFASTNLLSDICIVVNPLEKTFIEEHMDDFKEMGFYFEWFFENTIRIYRIPVQLKDINIRAFFMEILANLNDYKKITMKDLLRDKIAQTACKHAVKGNVKLSRIEIDALFKSMGGNTDMKCPHGRPVCVSFSKRDFEKMFKRIL